MHAGVELLLATLVVGLFVVLLRWAFGTGRSNPSPPSGGPGYGLLTEVAAAPTAEAAEALRRRLAGAQVRATVARAEGGGYRLLVFPADEVTATLVLRE